MSLIEFLSEFSYRRIVIGTVLIGACSGAMGTFLYLRRQSLMSDVIGHSATPGVMGAFLIVSLIFGGFDARSMPVIVVGALITGLIAVVLANKVADTTRIGIDATMAVVLSLFLGGGLLILQVIQRSHIRGKGGIEDLMFGNAATLTNLDVRTIAVVTFVVFLAVALLWRPITLMTFDPTLAKVSGLKTAVLSHTLRADRACDRDRGEGGGPDPHDRVRRVPAGRGPTVFSNCWSDDVSVRPLWGGGVGIGNLYIGDDGQGSDRPGHRAGVERNRAGLHDRRTPARRHAPWRR